MPIQNVDRRKGRQHYRRAALIMLLLPVAGCVAAPWSIRMPWSSAPSVAQAESEGRVATTSTPIFQTVAHRMQTLADTESLVATADATLSSAGALVDPMDDFSDSGDPNVADLNVAGSAVEESDFATLKTVVPSPIVEAVPQVIDLASALGMAGGNAWTIQLARQRTVEAHADWKQAKAMWLPTLQFGVGWNKHDGRIQATDGQVSEVSRGSLFVGGGATLGMAPSAGGSGGPLRLVADLALADAYFAPKIASRQLSARKAGVSIAKNQALLDAGVAYVDLLEAAGQVADAEAAIAGASQLLELTQSFAEAGAGAQADVDRAATQTARLTRQLQNANRLYRTRSANLSRRLRLDSRAVLHPADQVIVPIELSADIIEIDSLIGIALGGRPEINELSHEIAGLCLEVKKSDVAPWIPLVAMTTSAGNFGGGNGSSLDNQAGRSDVDLQALWQLENLGVGVSARRSRARAQLAQQRIALADLRDQITAEVVAARENVLNYRSQIDTANGAVELAESSFDRNLQRVRADEGLPIELLQAILAKAGSLSDRTNAVSNYNRAQLQLLFATGQMQ